MSLTKKLLANLAAGALAATFSTSASADVIIDLFLVNQSVFDTTADTIPVNASTSAGHLTILGGQRDIEVNMTSDAAPLNVNNAVRMDIAGGLLSFSTDSLAFGTGLVQLDGPDPGGIALNHTGLGAFNLSATGATAFTFTTIEADGNFQFEIRAFSNASTWSIVRLQANQVPFGSPEDSVIPLAGFAACGASDPSIGVITVICGPGGAVNFASLGALELFLNPTGSNARIDLTITGVTAVPEPGTLALLAGALLAGGFVARRRRS